MYVRTKKQVKNDKIYIERFCFIFSVQDNAEDIQNYADLFDMVGDDKEYGQLRALKDLKSYYGWWEVTIEAYDHGEPRMSNSSTYDIHIRPYNFHAPVIIYPVPNKSIRIW